jgi:type I restriction enzyme S subunit
MDRTQLLQHFDTLAETPEAVAKLRRLVLEFGVRGRLVQQDPKEESATVMLERIAREKAKAVDTRKKSMTQEEASIHKPPYSLPQSWCWARFDAIATIKSNLVPPAEFPNHPHVAPDNIEKGKGRLLECRTVRQDEVKSGNHRFSSGQISYSKIRPNLSKAAIVNFEGLCSADMYPFPRRSTRGICSITFCHPRFCEWLSAVTPA